MKQYSPDDTRIDIITEPLPSDKAYALVGENPPTPSERHAAQLPPTPLEYYTYFLNDWLESDRNINTLEQIVRTFAPYIETSGIKDKTIAQLKTHVDSDTFTTLTPIINQAFAGTKGEERLIEHFSDLTTTDWLKVGALFSGIAILGLGASLFFIGRSKTTDPGAITAKDHATRGLEQKTTVYNSQTRNYWLCTPDGLDRSQPTDLLFGFHGTGGSPAAFNGQTQFCTEGPTHNYITVLPEAIALNGMGQNVWVDADRGFIKQLQTELASQFTLGNTHVTGLSNGGTLAIRMLCDSQFAASNVFPVSTNENLAQPCSPTQPTNMFVDHYTGDPIVSQTTQPTLIQYLANANGCTDTPTNTTLSDGTVVTHFNNCANNVIIEHHEHPDGNPATAHNWHAGQTAEILSQMDNFRAQQPTPTPTPAATQNIGAIAGGAAAAVLLVAGAAIVARKKCGTRSPHTEAVKMEKTNSSSGRSF